MEEKIFCALPYYEYTRTSILVVWQCTQNIIGFRKDSVALQPFSNVFRMMFACKHQRSSVVCVCWTHVVGRLWKWIKKVKYCKAKIFIISCTLYVFLLGILLSNWTTQKITFSSFSHSPKILSSWSSRYSHARNERV